MGSGKVTRKENGYGQSRHESTLESFNMNKQAEETVKVVGDFLEEINYV